MGTTILLLAALTIIGPAIGLIASVIESHDTEVV